MWEKEKLHVPSNFLSHIVFKRLVLQTRKNQGLFGKGLTKCHLMLVNDLTRDNTIRNPNETVQQIETRYSFNQRTQSTEKCILGTVISTNEFPLHVTRVDRHINEQFSLKKVV